MPYLEDGETWDDAEVYEEGMAENQPGHKKFAEYKLPRWAKHPINHPFTGILVGPKEFMHTAGDGFNNPLMWSIAHIGCKFGDIGILEMCTDEELNAQDAGGHTPANYCVQYGTAWCLQWLVTHGCDVTTSDVCGLTPEDMIWRNNRLHTVEMSWMYEALKGELSEKNSLKAQEYHLIKNRSAGVDPLVAEKVDNDVNKLRRYCFGLGDFQMRYPSLTAEERARLPLDLPPATVTPIERKMPPLPAAMLFPGQGSQYVGMIKDEIHKPVVKDMLIRATRILGWNVKDLMLNGPESQLSETRHCQPVMFLAGMVALEKLRETRPEVVERPQAVAGLSLGEYTAICAAGVLDFDDCMKLVKVRAEAMQRATQLTPQAMCSIAGLDRAKVENLCEEAKRFDTSPASECKVANFLFTAGFTCAGTQDAVAKLCELALRAKALQARKIQASGGFHTRLMEPAQEELNAALDAMHERMKRPRCAIYFNVSGRKVSAGADTSIVRDALERQLTSEVLWEPTIKALIRDGVKDFYETGPLKQIKSMMKRIDHDSWKRTENISV